MLPRVRFKPIRRRINSSVLIHQSKYSSIPILEDRKTQSPLQEHDFHSHLRDICSRECKIIQSRQVIDKMPERLKLSLKTAKTVHSQSLRLGLSADGNLENSILDLYAKCGNVRYAGIVFSHLQVRDESAWNSIMNMNSRKGSFKDVVDYFLSMRCSGVVGDQFSFAMVLSACAKLMNLELGEQLHCVAMKMGLEAGNYCQGALIDMYVKCGCLEFATRIFDGAVDPDRVSWTAMISGFSHAGLTTKAIEIFEQMQELGHIPDNVLSVTILSACVGQGRLEDACRLFSQMPEPSSIAWNVMISGHVKGGFEEKAIDFFKNMVKSGIEPTRSTLGSVFCAIAAVANHKYGLQVHSWAIKKGLDTNVYAGSSLLNMYAKCQRMEAAKAVFDGLEEQNDVLWNALLGGYSQNGHAREVLELFVNMKVMGFQPDEYTYTSVLSACACLENIDIGRQVHTIIIKNEIGANLFVQNSLVDMYAKCGALFNARKLFERIKNRDNVSWNAIIVGYVQEDDEKKAFLMFRRMMIEGNIAPDEVSLASILGATANLQDLCKGRQVHCFLVKYGLENGRYAGSSLIDMYCKCGLVENATLVFSHLPEKSVVGMNALISGHAQLSLHVAVNIFKNMSCYGLKPSEVTFATLLEACSGDPNLNFGRQIHCSIVKLGLPYGDEFLAVSLLGMYMSAQRNNDAINLFSELPHPKSTVLWTVLISGNAQNDCGEEALLWYQEMRAHNALPDQATFASILRACSSLASLQDGSKIHSLVFRIGYDKDELTGSALLDMYAKCGDMESSSQVFREMISRKDVISWNSMIVGYAKNGYAERALEIFDEMRRSEVKPDEVTFLGVLTACSHAGKVSEGRVFYEEMIARYGIQPRVDHCACMVDLFGRWGFLGEAERFINNMGFQPDSMIWATYLSSCRLHGDDVRGRHAAEKLIELDPQNSSPYVLLSSIHAASGNWDGVNRVREKMIEKRVKKFAGSSKISRM
ncbi:Pentatricopeptide repeat-containing protein -mitochondrial [Striga hermonthica]|uniref:Pentatricopeptide repeat-containing protein -mitochondrial n=1 Tax=Striga hermonthica TaxID=68872 RepID=A0A9N7MSP8_STRHE|nr:Pentatricopeptide repeat-containing protein -mitochondrial [Striga hermonthica]